MIIELSHLALTYQSAEGETEALRDVSFGVEEGEFVSLLGPSGCGKSSLLKLMAGLEKPSAGTIRLDGEPIAGCSGKVGYMPQRDALFPWRSVWGNVTLAPELRGEKDGASHTRLRVLLEQYGLREFADRSPAALSGGMRQRVSLIRTLGASPRLLLLDEPFSALDAQTRLSVGEDIRRIIRSEGLTAVLVTHDIGESVALSDRVIVLTERPGTVLSRHDLGELKALPPHERRSHPLYAAIFDRIGKELGVLG